MHEKYFINAATVRYNFQVSKILLPRPLGTKDYCWRKSMYFSYPEIGEPSSSHGWMDLCEIVEYVTRKSKFPSSRPLLTVFMVCRKRTT